MLPLEQEDGRGEAVRHQDAGAGPDAVHSPPPHTRVLPLMERNPYAILGVDPTASDEDIKRRFHALARLHHPDKSSAGDATGSADSAAEVRAFTSASRVPRLP
jgi:DnaJ-domain-containing protein 1